LRLNRLFNLFSANAKRGTFKAEGNVIYIYDVIVGSDAEAEYFGGVSPEAFARTLLSMTGPVSLRINSPGGDVFAAQAMKVAIGAYPYPVTAYVDGYAASAASVIAIAADKCIMDAGSMMMIHNAWTMAVGNSADLMKTADLLSKVDGTLAQAYADKAGGDASGFAALMATETWFTGDEALSAGLCDEVAASGIKAESPSKIWDLSAYDAPPQATCVTVTVEVEIDEADEASDPIDPMEALSTPPAEPADPADEIGHRVRQHATRMALIPA
jgi:ATP-dependent protease ClpP protease subunit